jgi:hypothetical protein
MIAAAKIHIKTPTQTKMPPPLAAVERANPKKCAPTMNAMDGMR